MQKQQAVSKVRDELQQWAELVQQLTSEPVQSLDAGQGAVASVLETVQGLEDQHRHALEDLAGKDEDLSTAEARTGTLECQIAAPGCGHATSADWNKSILTLLSGQHAESGFAGTLSIRSMCRQHDSIGSA